MFVCDLIIHNTVFVQWQNRRKFCSIEVGNSIIEKFVSTVQWYDHGSVIVELI